MHDFTADAYLERLYQQARPQFPFTATNEAEWQSWRQALLPAFQERLGNMPTEKCPLQPEVLETVDCGDYVQQRIALQCDYELWMPAYVLIPKREGKMPAMVAAPGHGFGNREAVGLDVSGQRADDPGYHKRFPEELCKRGFVVIVPELLGFGDRRISWDTDKPLGHSSCHHISAYLLMLGRTMAGMRVWDVVRSLDYLETMPKVDMGRVGIMGISGGGLVATFAAALEPRIKAAVVSGYLNTFHDCILAMHHCIDNYLYDQVVVCEMPEIGGLIAPKPLLMECGEDDPIFPIAASKAAYAQLQRIYQVAGVPEKLDIDIFAAGHQISGAKAYDFLQKWL